MKYKGLIFFFAVFSFLFLVKTKVQAIPVSPDKYFIDVNVGQQVKQELTIYGREQLDQAKKIYVYPVGMIKEGEENDRSFYLPDPNNPAEPANWIKLSQNEVLIGPGQTVKLPWTITPSSSASCGTNLAAIMIATEPITTFNEGTKVTIKKEIISQVHVNLSTIPGKDCSNTMSNLEFVEFKVDQLIPIFNHGDVPFVTRIKNTGNLISKSPRGYIEIYGFGPKATIEFNDEQLDIYPSTTRKFMDQWFEEGYPKDGNILSQLIFEITHPRFGRYEAKLGLTKNVDTQIVATTYFWVIPWKLILLLVAILGIAFVLSTRNKKKK